MTYKSRKKLLEEILVATVSGGGGGGAGVSVSHMIDNTYTAASPSEPLVGGNVFAAIDCMTNLSALSGTGYTTGNGITGLTEGKYCEIDTSAITDNITGQITLYFELVSAIDRTNSYERRGMVFNKVDTENSDTVKFCFVVTADMAANGVRVVIGGHRGTLGTKAHTFKHTIKEYL